MSLWSDVELAFWSGVLAGILLLAAVLLGLKLIRRMLGGTVWRTRMLKPLNPKDQHRE